MSDAQTIALGFTTRLRTWYWITGTVIVINVVAIMLYGPIAGSVLWDSRTLRVMSLRFWWFWGQSLAFYTPMLTFFLMYHTWYGVYYWIHIIGIVIAIVIHLLYGIMVIAVFTTCSALLCNGLELPSADFFPGQPDWSLWAYTALIAVFFVSDIWYLVFNFILHRKTEFRMAAEVAAAERAPPLAQSYMRRAQWGGTRWLYDAFAPPGMHSYSIAPANASVLAGPPTAIGTELDPLVARVGATVASATDDTVAIDIAPSAPVHFGVTSAANALL